MATESLPELTGKQRKDLMISASAFRPTAGLELAGSQEDPTLRHIAPSTISDPANYNILGDPQW